MKINLKVILLVVVCSVIFYSVLIIIGDVPKIQEQVKNFKIIYLPIILSLIASGWMLVFLRWHLLVKNLGFKVPIKSNFTIFFSSMTLGMIPGRIGDLVKSQMLKNRHDIPRTKTAPIVILERYYDLAGAAIVSSFGILYFEPAGYIIGIISIFVIIAFVVASSKTLFEKFFAKIGRFKFTNKFVEPLSDSFDVVHVSTRGKISIVSIILSCGHWLLVCCGVYFILVAYDVNTVSILEIIPIYLSSIVLGAISFLPGGLGVAEGSLAGFLNLLVDDISITISLAIIIRIITLWSGVIVGFVFLRFVKDIFFEKKE